MKKSGRKPRKPQRSTQSSFLKLLDLPTEILIQILSDDSLDYLTLKSLSSTCHSFRELVRHCSDVEAKCIAVPERRTLFRERYDIQEWNRLLLSDGQAVIRHVHPCLKALGLRPTPNLKPRNDYVLPDKLPVGANSFGLISKSGMWVPLRETNVGDENLTCPPTAFLVVLIEFHRNDQYRYTAVIDNTKRDPDGGISGGEAITVQQLVKAVNGVMHRENNSKYAHGYPSLPLISRGVRMLKCFDIETFRVDRVLYFEKHRDAVLKLPSRYFLKLKFTVACPYGPDYETQFVRYKMHLRKDIH